MPIDSAAGEPWSPRCWSVQLSAIGYDTSGTQAAVFVSQRCDDSGHGEIAFLRRDGTMRWRLYRWYNIWAAG
jgi:hypothetical protein